MTITLTCDMSKDCAEPVTHIDQDGYAYCTKHGLTRRRAGGEREAMRVLYTTRDGAVRERTRAINELKAVIVSAPEELRDRLRTRNGAALVSACHRLRDTPARDRQYRASVAVLRRLAVRIRDLDAEIRAHERDLAALTREHCPQLVAETGVGPITAAQAYISWSHPGRCRNEAAYANLGGVAPIEAIRAIVTDHAAKVIDGVFIDAWSAKAIVTVYDALNVENRLKFTSLPIAKMGSVAWKLVSKR